jgi:hypothetical protein
MFNFEFIILRVYDDEPVICTAVVRCLHSVMVACATATHAGTYFAHIHIEQFVSQLQIKPIEACVCIFANSIAFVRVASVDVLNTHADSILRVCLQAVNKWNLLLLLGGWEVIFLLLSRLHSELVVGCEAGAKVILLSQGRRRQYVLQVGTELLRTYLFFADHDAVASITAAFSPSSLVKAAVHCVSENNKHIAALLQTLDRCAWQQLVTEAAAAADPHISDLLCV